MWLKRLAVEFEFIDHEIVELWLQGADRDVATIARFIGVVHVCGAGKKALTRPVVIHPHRLEAVEHRHERVDPVNHSRIDNLAFASRPGVENCADHPEGEQHATASHVGDQVSRRYRLAALLADEIQCSRQRHVVHVVAGHARKRTILAPAGHTPVDEFRVFSQQVVRPEAEALHDARTETLDETVCRCNELPDDLDGRRVFEIASQRLAIARQRIQFRVHPGAGPLDADNFRAHVGEHHAGKRCRSKTGELDDSYTLQGSHELPLPGGIPVDLFARRLSFRAGSPRCAACRGPRTSDRRYRFDSTCSG